MDERTRNRVLIVEDDAVIRMAVRKFLTAPSPEPSSRSRACSTSRIAARSSSRRLRRTDLE
jgi:DNA-binding response OmpR family regulator